MRRALFRSNGDKECDHLEVLILRLVKFVAGLFAEHVDISMISFLWLIMWNLVAECICRMVFVGSVNIDFVLSPFVNRFSVLFTLFKSLLVFLLVLSYFTPFQ